jgi:hypothetical protein
LQTTSQNLLQHLSLLFVPAGTGIMVHLHRVADEWLPLLLSLLISTAATLIVTALVMKLCCAPDGDGRSIHDAGHRPDLGLPLGLAAARADHHAARLPGRLLALPAFRATTRWPIRC